MNIKSSAPALFAVLFVLSQSSSAATSQALINQLESISDSIGKHIDIQAVSDSLYRQVRPIVQVENKKLSPGQVDKKVRTYILKKYAPILVMKYSLQFSKMKKAGLHFGGCKSLHALPFDKNTDMALCASKTLKTLDVRYFIRNGNRNWETTSVYEFSEHQHDLMLTGIHLNVKKGDKFRISGI